MITLPEHAGQAYTCGLSPSTEYPGAMRELLELQSGQVAFISGLMSGFAISIAAQILRYGINSISLLLPST